MRPKTRNPRCAASSTYGAVSNVGDYHIGSMSLYLWHSEIPKLVPQVLNSVQANQGSDEKSNPLNTAYAADGDTGEHQPKTPLRREGVMSKTMEFGPAEDCGEGEAQEHRVQQNKSADGGVGVFEQDHHGDEPHGWASKVELLRSEVCQWHADCAECGVEESHEGVVHFLGVLLSRLEFEGAIVTSQVARETDKHLSERWVDIEVELAFQIVGAELSKALFGVSLETRVRVMQGAENLLSLVPRHNV
jgi:hypothetical protein